jgi:ectoine hydroxylase-related dioxygenase (phytanoyl-CoA dioxygenase family)
LFRRDAPTAEEIAAFHRDGYIALPEIFTETALARLIGEVLAQEAVKAFLALSKEERRARGNPFVYFVRPWNERGCWSDRLIDAPLITALLRATVGPKYHFCHSSMNLALRGAGRIGFHQDHHHWFHQNPINLAEREKGYIQVLYYPNGFTRGDRSLSVIPGSHRVSPTPEVTPEALLRGDFNAQAERELAAVDLELPPGSLVYLNARMFHGVAAKPLDSPQVYRIFLIDIFKEAGPPHRYTQEIPPEWLERASPERRRMFTREAYTPECWLETAG